MEQPASRESWTGPIVDTVSAVVLSIAALLTIWNMAPASDVGT